MTDKKQITRIEKKIDWEKLRKQKKEIEKKYDEFFRVDSSFYNLILR